jgi:manganese transport protein
MYVDDDEERERAPLQQQATLPEAYRSVPVPRWQRREGGCLAWWRTLAAYIGPGYMVAVGYMDPGNWATDLAGGAKYEFSLLFVVLLSSLLAMFLQVRCQGSDVHMLLCMYTWMPSASSSSI